MFVGGLLAAFLKIAKEKGGDRGVRGNARYGLGGSSEWGGGGTLPAFFFPGGAGHVGGKFDLFARVGGGGTVLEGGGGSYGWVGGEKRGGGLEQG